jgi:5-deoxy-glucuronate isomerase
MNANQYVVHSRRLSGDSGELISFSRQAAGWDWMSFSARRLAAGEVWEVQHAGEESVHVLLAGMCDVHWGTSHYCIGERKNVFEGLPYALYLAPGERARYTARTVCEIAECHVPAEGGFPSRLLTPKEASTSLRGGGNASRQIVDVIPPSFPAQRLIAVEVYTPGGNWSSYPPHKHDVHNPPDEADLDEIYYYRTNHLAAFAHQRLYTPDGSRDVVVTARDGDAVLIRDGYHPVVAGPGYDVYYLNFIAGSVRSLANTEDPQHKWIRSLWKDVDARLPLVRAMEPAH